jgi:L-ribulokinase
MYNDAWGGYPDEEFLGTLDPKLAELRRRMPAQAHAADRAPAASRRSGRGARACRRHSRGRRRVRRAPRRGRCGIKAPGTLVKIIGTSTCDMMVAPSAAPPDIPGLCGIVDGSVLPGCYGLEAGQSAVGDIFNWFVNYVQPGGPGGTHEALAGGGQAEARGIGLWLSTGTTAIAPSWSTSGSRGCSSVRRCTPPRGDLPRADRGHGLRRAHHHQPLRGVRRGHRRVVNCGGIAEKSPLVMQIYADVTGRPMKVSRSAQTCALGSAIAGAVVAGRTAGGHDTYTDAQRAMTGLKSRVYEPKPDAHAVYAELYPLYRSLHDAFGTPDWQGNLYGVMKQLIDIRTRVRR